MRSTVLTEENLNMVINSYMDLLASIENKKLRDNCLKMMEVIGDRFFEAPASAKLTYHNCFVGGLAEHSLRVYKNLSKLCKSFQPNISNDSIIVVSLFHDLGKIGSLDEDYYVPQESNWHRDRGEHYVHNPKLEYLAVSQRTVRLLSQFDIPLSESEYKAILICDGQYIQENKSYAHKEGWIGLLAHQADMIACRTEKEKWENAQ